MTDHKPRAGRTAWICEGRKNEPCNRRRFQAPDEPEPICDIHGKMTRQANRPYRGQSIPSEHRDG